MTRVAGIVLMAALAAVPSFAQQSTAEIRGRVLDPQQAAVPGATVRVTNQETGTFRETLSNSDGAYFIAALAPGSYTLVAEVPGFKKYSRKDVRLDLGHTTTLDLQLEIGNVTDVDQAEAQSRRAGRSAEEPLDGLQGVGEVVVQHHVVEPRLLGQLLLERHAQALLQLAGVLRPPGPEPPFELLA